MAIHNQPQLKRIPVCALTRYQPESNGSRLLRDPFTRCKSARREVARTRLLIKRGAHTITLRGNARPPACSPPPIRRMRFFTTLVVGSWLTCRMAFGGGLEVTPSTVRLTDPLARQQLVVSADGEDVTRAASYSVSDPGLAEIDQTGHLKPRADGTGLITITHQDRVYELPLEISGFSTPRPIDFRNEIEPILSRYGCNAGGCHGKASGQNGFKLSLFGFDAAFDHEEIARRARGRRIFPAAAENSLLLQKAVNQLPHGGGKRFDVDSEPYNLLETWIASGASASSPEAARVTKIAMHLPERVLKNGRQQQLAVLATFSDGNTRDVTRSASYSSNLDVVAHVTENGLVTASEQSGEATIMAQFMGQVAVFNAIVPHGEPLSEIPGFEPAGYVDRLTMEKWKKLGLIPSHLCDDPTFIRRVTIDLAGRLPTSDEIREFLANTSPHKREELVDRLLDSPDYPAYFALRWSAILRNSQLAGANQAAYAFHNWIKDSIARNQPYDEFVRGIVAASGEWQDAPAINWLWQNRDDQLHQTTADVAQVFLGTRLQCARCHHHPYERFGQEDYYGLAGFFTRLGRKSFGEPPPYFASASPTTGERNPLTDKTPEPKYLDGEYAKFTPEQDPRQALVDWMSKPENPLFAKALVNRLWGHFLGRGLVHEVDDLRATNPPSNPELLDALAKDFIDHKFDVKHIIRTIVTSKVYQLSSTPTDKNRHDRQNFARFYARRLVAEVMLDAVDGATGTKSRFSGMAASSRAVDLPHEGFGSYFLDTFDRPRRVTTCECERSSGATLAQVLLLANSNEVEDKLADGQGRIARMLKAEKPMKDVVAELYLSSFSRYPSEQELNVTHAFLERLPENDRSQGIEDVLWTILNSKEFMFNH
jgi:hypothetical protein